MKRRGKRFTALAMGAVTALAAIAGGASPADAAITSTTGQIVEITPPPSVQFDVLQSNTQAFAFEEKQDFVLPAGLTVNITEPGTYADDLSQYTPGVIPAGTKVDSQLIHIDPVSDGGDFLSYEGTVVTDGEILGIVVFGTTLTDTDLLGAPGTVYPTGQPERGFEPLVANQSDILIEQVDRHTVEISYRVKKHVDQVRIVTEAELLAPGVASEVHDGDHDDITGTTVPVGTVVHDKAIVTGSGPTPTGNVIFNRFENGECTEPAVATETVALGGDGTAESSTFVAGAGAMAYRVHYEGDASYAPADGPCEPLAAAKHASAVDSKVHDGAHADITGQTVSAGTGVHDKAFVTGSGPTPTGDVVFHRYTNAECTGTSAATETVALGGDGTAESSTFTFAADMAYKVVYGGDANYDGGDGPCEPLFGKRTPNVASEVHQKYDHEDITNQTVAAGTYVHDKAIVTGSGPTPTGTVVFKRYTNGTCYGSPASTQTVTLSGGTAESANFQTVQGSLSYKVRYSGDANYVAGDGPCEPLKVERTGCEGCTPKFWKYNTGRWQGYTTSTSFEAVVGRDVLPGNPTFLQVLSLPGGGVNGLARETAAALLNAAHTSIEYQFTTTQIISTFQCVVDSGSSWLVEYLRSVLACFNSKNCPYGYWC